MAQFDRALPYILSHEGGWVDDPDDPGGATNYGITLTTARHHGIMTKDDLRVISPAAVADIYRSDYWEFSGLVSQRVATKLFDMCVNMGAYHAVKIAQEGLNDLGASLAEDGIYGPKTEAAINAVRPDDMLYLLCDGSADYYRAIVDRKPSQAKFLKGWLRRAAKVPSE